MEKKLKNKVAIITGGSGFLGKQFCKALSESGCMVINIDTKRNKLFEKEIRQKNLKIFNFKGDITKESQLIKLKKIFLKKFKKIDILINNACNDYKPDLKNIKKITLENFSKNIWKEDLEVALTGSLLCTKIFGSIMVKQRRGTIINISSDLGIIAPNQTLYQVKNIQKSLKPVTYSVVKHGLIGLTKYTASTWAKYNIRCNSLCPGGMYNNQNKIFLKKIKKLIPMNRMANLNEFNSTLVYLASDSSSYMNGHSLILDGGRSIW